MNNNLKYVNAKDKWRTLVNKTLKDVRRINNFLPEEWKSYSTSEITFWRRLKDVNDAIYESIKLNFDILPMYQNGTIDFLK